MPLTNEERSNLISHGWTIGRYADLLGLSAEDHALVETRLRVARLIRAKRQERQLTQTWLAAAAGTDHSRVAKMQKAHSSTSLDAMILMAYSIGATVEQVGLAIAGIELDRTCEAKVVAE
ncbi:MAG TPA: XRE family transcriptional regulator [Armatimonadota bacterium]|jgi:UDP-N-acetylenolpyruvoylglucosamine reductase